MFGFVYELLGGQHQELARRRRAEPRIDFDPTVGAFVADEAADTHSAWLGRGELPGRMPAEEITADDQSVADEMRQLAQRPPTSR